MDNSSFSTSSFEGKVCVVAGGTQGLGEATARLMAERGASALVLVGRSFAKGMALAGELTSEHCNAVFHSADLGDVDECQQVMSVVEDTFGTVHAVAHVAALTDRGSIWNTTPEMWDRMMAVNLRAPFFVLQGAADLMERTDTAGSIVLVGSVAGDGGAPRLLPYSVSKGALQALTRNAAFSLAQHQIRVNLLQLGWMNTPNEHTVQIEQEGQPADWLTAASAEQPFGRLIETDEAARAICYLASDESGLMTGATIDFDQSVVGAGNQPVPGLDVRRPVDE